MSDQQYDITNEHRRFRRINFVETVQVHSEDLEGAEPCGWEAQCIDISMLGMLLTVPEGFPLVIGTPFEVRLILAEDVTIEMPCTLVHVQGCRAGFRAEVMSLESLTNLRRLLELNLADCDEVERELTELISQ